MSRLSAYKTDIDKFRISNLCAWWLYLFWSTILTLLGQRAEHRTRKISCCPKPFEHGNDSRLTYLKKAPKSSERRDGHFISINKSSSVEPVPQLLPRYVPLHATAPLSTVWATNARHRSSIRKCHEKTFTKS